MTFHICCALNENPEAGTTPRLSPARPPGAIEWKNLCLRLATFNKAHNHNKYKIHVGPSKNPPILSHTFLSKHYINIKPERLNIIDKNMNLLFKLFFLLFVTRERHNLNLPFNQLKKNYSKFLNSYK